MHVCVWSCEHVGVHVVCVGCECGAYGTRVCGMYAVWSMSTCGCCMCACARTCMVSMGCADVYVYVVYV